MSQSSLFAPLLSFDSINQDELNRALVEWGHKMGALERPYQKKDWFHGLRYQGELIAVTAASGLVAASAAGFGRSEAFELSRVCAKAPDWCRPVVRLWRQAVFPSICEVHGYSWAVSYQDAVEHTGDLYRFDGWVRVAFSASGNDARSGRTGRRKWIWAWHADATVRHQRRRDAQAVAQ